MIRFTLLPLPLSCALGGQCVGLAVPKRDLCSLGGWAASQAVSYQCLSVLNLSPSFLQLLPWEVFLAFRLCRLYGDYRKSRKRPNGRLLSDLLNNLSFFPKISISQPSLKPVLRTPLILLQETAQDHSWQPPHKRKMRQHTLITVDKSLCQGGRSKGQA